MARVSGEGAYAAFQHEAGGHRWQRVPPSEKRGRVHTSTVAVAVLGEPEAARVELPEKDLLYRATRGSGPGGQHRNKTSTAIQLTHLPTGLMVRVDGGRSQHQNRALALELLRARLFDGQRRTAAAAREAERRGQLGSGERGDKRRTIRCQDGVVVDHVLGQRWSLRQYLRGEW